MCIIKKKTIKYDYLGFAINEYYLDGVEFFSSSSSLGEFLYMSEKRQAEIFNLNGKTGVYKIAILKNKDSAKLFYLGKQPPKSKFESQKNEDMIWQAAIEASYKEDKGSLCLYSEDNSKRVRIELRQDGIYEIFAERLYILDEEEMQYADKWWYWAGESNKTLVDSMDNAKKIAKETLSIM